MTTDRNWAIAPLNPRMPVLLEPEDYQRWLHGPIEDVIAFQFRPFPAERLVKRVTDALGGAQTRDAATGASRISVKAHVRSCGFAVVNALGGLKGGC